MARNPAEIIKFVTFIQEFSNYLIKQVFTKLGQNEQYLTIFYLCT